jgi:hypothetical protein
MNTTELRQSIITTRPTGRRWLWLAAGFALLVLAYVGFDLYATHTTRLREFDPQAVARIETEMWRSYYDKERLKLFTQLAGLMRTQYRMPFVRSNEAAYQAAKAAFVFKEGKQRADYEKALPNLISFYRDIRAQSDIPFDVERAARLELEWWIVHRQRAQHKGGDLARALAELQAEIFRLPVERFAEHAQLRAEAMTIRDDQAAAGGVSEAGWRRIDELLQDSWLSLWKAVNGKGARG